MKDKKWLILAELLIAIVQTSSVYSDHIQERLQALIDEIEKEEKK